MKRFVQIMHDNPGPSSSKTPKLCPKSSGLDDESRESSSQMTSSKLKYLFDEFYKIISREGHKISALCQKCSQIVNGSINSSGNFLSHYKCKHASMMSKIEKSRHNNGHDKHVNTKQAKLTDVRTKTISKQKINDLVFEYILSEMRPLITCEKPSFRKLILGLTESNDETILPNRKQLSKQLKNNYNVYVSKLTDLLEQIKFICTTADIWSANNRSFLGMTCHFIDSQTYERKSYVLGCRRIKGSHNYLNITEIMTDITQGYNIHYSKITHTVTDNASNFGKSFRNFSMGLLPSRTISGIGDLNEYILDSEDSDLETDDVENISIGQVFINLEQQNRDDSICLPQHMKCCAHTLNLIATNDVSKITNTSYINISESTFKKLYSFWTLISRSTVASDKILEMCACKFPVPALTRWNSLYDASLKVLKHKQQLVEGFEYLCIPKLKQHEWVFLEEYCMVLEPLAVSLDKLQGEKNSFLGYVLPTILVIRRLLISFTNLQHCKPLSLAIVKALETQFSYLFDLNRPESKMFIIASVSHPKFKLSCIPLRYVNLCKNLFLTECNIAMNKNIMENSVNLNVEEQESSNHSDDDFYDHILKQNKNDIDETTYETTFAKLQATSFLNSKKKELNILDEYPIVKEVFFKFNTTIPSSAPVERLFSKAIQILTPRRNRLEDKTFEMILCCRSHV